MCETRRSLKNEESTFNSGIAKSIDIRYFPSRRLFKERASPQLGTSLSLSVSFSLFLILVAVVSLGISFSEGCKSERES